MDQVSRVWFTPQQRAELWERWWGTPKNLHIDCWAEISEVDGYEVELRPEPFNGAERTIKPVSDAGESNPL